MSEDTIIVGVDPARGEHGAIALGATLAHVTGSRLLLVSVYEPRQTPWSHAAAAYEHGLRRAVMANHDRLADLEVEELVLPGASAARVLHHLADERRPVAIVVSSSPRAAWGHTELGLVSERLLHGGAVPVAIAPRGYANRPGDIRRIGVGYVGTPESEDAARAGAALAASTESELELILVFDPADYSHAMEPMQTVEDLRAQAARDLAGAAASATGVSVTTQMLDGDPAKTLARLSKSVDLLILGSRSYGPLRAVLLGGVSGVLVHGAGCPVMVVPHVPDAEHDVALIGGLEAGMSLDA